MAIDPVTASLIVGGLQGLSGALGASSDRKLTKEQMAQQDRQFKAGQQQQQGQQALLASQMDPLFQQKSRQKAALIAELMKGYSAPSYTPGGGLQGGLQLSPEIMQAVASFHTPEARGAAEMQFNQNAGSASGGQYAGAGDGVGYAPGALTPPRRTPIRRLASSFAANAPNRYDPNATLATAPTGRGL